VIFSPLISLCPFPNLAIIGEFAIFYSSEKIA
jgi:hypothetical protein